jgi:hypothetical protein
MLRTDQLGAFDSSLQLAGVGCLETHLRARSRRLQRGNLSTFGFGRGFAPWIPRSSSRACISGMAHGPRIMEETADLARGPFPVYSLPDAPGKNAQIGGE